MYYRTAHAAIFLTIFLSIGYVYLNRMDIPITRNFEILRDQKIESIEKERHSLAITIVQLKREQAMETELRETARSNSYSNPFRALNLEWYKIKIIYLNFLYFLFTYEIIFYFALFIFVFFTARTVFWKYYAL